MSLKNSIEFMLYTNFGIDFTDGQTDKILKVVIDKAYNDATMQGAYNALKKENSNLVDLEDIQRNISERIKDLLNKDSQDYLSWHNGVCSYLVASYKKVTLENNDSAFTYGNAQKWINMTMKYLYILSEIFHEYNSECEFDKYFGRIQNLHKDLLLPVDSYIIESLWNETKITLPIATKRNFRNEEYKDCRAKSWSKWNVFDYKDFRDTFRKTKADVLPLDWEHKEWIRIAKKRKNK